MNSKALPFTKTPGQDVMEAVFDQKDNDGYVDT